MPQIQLAFTCCLISGLVSFTALAEEAPIAAPSIEGATKDATMPVNPSATEKGSGVKQLPAPPRDPAGEQLPRPPAEKIEKPDKKAGCRPGSMMTMGAGC